MGKWTVQHTEDVLLSKIRVAIESAIKAHLRENRQDGEARPVTFDEFVEDFDNKDAFTQKIMEILVKEYSERRMKATPVDRRFQIASRTSAALNSIPREAAVYDNCRPARWPRRSRGIFGMSLPQPEEDNTAMAGFDHSDDDATFSGAIRDGLFENALNELEDGEFGAYWNTTLNEAYSEDVPQLPERRYTLQNGDIRLQNGAGGGSGNSSAVASDVEFPSIQSNLAASRMNSRLGTLGSSSGRLGSLRTPLLRRNSIRRNRYARSGLWESEASIRRRLARGLSDEAEPSWRAHGEEYPTDSLRGAEYRQARPSETTIRRMLDNLESRESNVPYFASSPGTSSSRQNLRRGGLRPPEALLEANSSSLTRPMGLPFTMTPRHDLYPETLPPLVRSIPADGGPGNTSSIGQPIWALESQDNQVLAGLDSNGEPAAQIPPGMETLAGEENGLSQPSSL